MYLVDYVPIVVIMALATFLASVFVLGSVLLGPKHQGAVRDMPFECGHPSEGYNKKRFAVKFYGIAILFVLFDIEAVFLYPWAVVLDQLALFALVEMFLFIGILGLALWYVWAKGGLEWD